MRTLLIALLISLGISPATVAETYYVSTTGDNRFPGTSPDSAFASIRYTTFADSVAVSPGDTVAVLPGAYYEDRLWLPSGAGPDSFVVYMALKQDPDDVVAIDPLGCSPKQGCGACPADSAHCHWAGVFHLNQVNHVKVIGFDLSHGCRKGVGVYVYRGHNNHILDCTIDSTYAAGIHLTSTDSVWVDGNTVTRSLQGDSRNEAVVIQRTTNFVISNNTVYDLPDGPGRNGIMVDPGSGPGRVHGNLAYDVPGTCGICVNGASDIDIYQNTVRNCGFGITISCEKEEQQAERIRVANNLIYANTRGGIEITKWISDADQDPSDSTGRKSRISILNNTVVDNGWGITIAHDPKTGAPPESVLVRNNIVCYNRAAAQVRDVTDQATIDHNLVFPVSGSGSEDLGGHVVAQEPLFIDPTTRDYRLDGCSAGVDAGDSTGAPGVDHSGRVRPDAGGRHDIGAHERARASTCPHASRHFRSKS